MGDKTETLKYSTTIPLAVGSSIVSQVTITIINGATLPINLGGVSIKLPAHTTLLTTDTSTDALKQASSLMLTGSTTTSPSSPSTLQTSYSMVSLSNSLLSSVTSSAPTTTSSGARVGNEKHVSAGGAAGIGIGSAIGGAIVAILIFLLLMRKSRESGSKSKKPRVASTVLGRNKLSPALADYESTQFEFDDQNAVAIVERALPQPADDQTIGGEMSKLCTLIKNHIQSYYHNGRTQESIDSVNFDEMEVAGRKLPISTPALISLLANSKTRFSALRFYLSWITLQRIEPTCDPDRTFLPPEVARFLKSMANGEDSTPSGLIHKMVFT